ncbi:hypothetical protein BDF22DRAFT_693110 [Syncephalis plumigaleata]|nr:hypothetical protein BDF22DRAFT_693110 [Syncephalis plumigaleata]
MPHHQHSSSHHRNNGENPQRTIIGSNTPAIAYGRLLTDADNTGPALMDDSIGQHSSIIRQDHTPTLSVNGKKDIGAKSSNRNEKVANINTVNPTQTQNVTEALATNKRMPSLALSSLSSVTFSMPLNPSEIICAPLEPPSTSLPGNAVVPNGTASTAIQNSSNYTPIPPMVADTLSTNTQGGTTARRNLQVNAPVKSSAVAVNRPATPATSGARVPPHALQVTPAPPSAPAASATNGNVAIASNNVFRIAQYIRRPMVAPNPSLASFAATPSTQERSSSLHQPRALPSTSRGVHTNTNEVTENAPMQASDDKDEQGCLYNCQYALYSMLSIFRCNYKK